MKNVTARVHFSWSTQMLAPARWARFERAREYFLPGQPLTSFQQFPSNLRRHGFVELTEDVSNKRPPLPCLAKHNYSELCDSSRETTAW